MTFEEFIYWEATTRDTIDFKKIYVDVAGDLIAGLMLSQIIYWHLPSKNGDSKLKVKKDGYLWIAKGNADWYDEIRITEWQAPRALKILEDRGIVEKRIYKFDGAPMNHIRIVGDRFLELFSNLVKAQRGNEGITQIQSGESLNSLTESTSENTKELKESGGENRRLKIPDDYSDLHPDTARLAHFMGINREKALSVIYDYPPEVQNTIKVFCSEFKRIPPSKKSKQYSKWIADAKELLVRCEDVELPVEAVVKEVKAIWEDKEFTVVDIGSIAKTVNTALGNFYIGKTARKKTYLDAYGNEVEQ